MENIALSGNNGPGSNSVQPNVPESSSVKDTTSEGSSSSEEKDITAGEKSLLQKLLRTKLVQSSKELEIIQRDPTSPLFSATSFEDLPL